MTASLRLKKEVSLNKLFLSLFLASCSSISPISTTSNQEAEKPQPVISKELVVKPGEVVKVSFVKNQLTQGGILKCDSKSVPYFISNDEYNAFIAESYFSKFKPIECVIEKNGKSNKVALIKVEDKEFPSERLNVDKRRVSLNTKDLKRVRKEQVFLNKNYASSPSNPYFEDSFMLPIDSLVTSIYGSKRIFNKSKQTQHLGTDFRAPVGEPIKAANSGKVVVARDLFFTGGTVTIDHGLGIFTIYGHLSKVQVQEGEFVPKGTQIGLAGATGRVTGPHLHWGVKVNGHFIEGESLVRESAD